MKKLLLTTFLCLAALVVPGIASAADTWLPDFDAGKHVQVSKSMEGRVTVTPDFDKLVQEKAKAHNLSVYVVITEQGDELTGSRDNWAPDMLHNRLWDRWRHESGFSEARILIVLYIRAKDSDVGSIAVRSGSYLHGLSINRDLFASSSGPVMPAARQYMRTDPQTGVLTILDNVNKRVADAKSGKASEPATFLGLEWWVWVIIIIVVALLIILICCLAKSSGGGGSSGSSWFFAGCGSSGGSSCSSGSSCGGGGCGGGGGC